MWKPADYWQWDKKLQCCECFAPLVVAYKDFVWPEHVLDSVGLAKEISKRALFSAEELEQKAQAGCSGVSKRASPTMWSACSQRRRPPSLPSSQSLPTNTRIVQYAAGVVCGAAAWCSVGVYVALRAFKDLNYYGGGDWSGEGEGAPRAPDRTGERPEPEPSVWCAVCRDTQMQCRAVARCSIFVLCWLPCHGLHLNFAKPHVPSRAAAVFANANEDATDNGLSAQTMSSSPIESTFHQVGHAVADARCIHSVAVW